MKGQKDRGKVDAMKKFTKFSRVETYGNLEKAGNKNKFVRRNWTFTNKCLSQRNGSETAIKEEQATLWIHPQEMCHVHVVR